MKLGDLWRLAWGNLRRSKLRNILTILGVVIGTSSVVLLVSLGAGLQANVVGTFENVGNVKEVSVSPIDATSQNSGGFGFTPRTITDQTVQQIRQIQHVARVDRSFQPGFLNYQANNNQTYSLQATGHDPSATVITKSKLAAGRLLQPGDSNMVIVPDTFANRIGSNPTALVNQPLGFTVSQLPSTGQGTIPSIPGIGGGGQATNATLTVIGVLDTGDATGTATSRTAYLPLDTALQLGAQLRGLPPESVLSTVGYSSLTVTADSQDNVKGIQQAITRLGYSAFAVQDLISGIGSFFLILQLILGGIGGIALVVAALGIANTMAMAVLERTREIGIMKAVGAAPSSISRMFLAESALIGLIGGIIGLVLGFALGKLIEVIILLIVRQQAGADATSNTPGIFQVPPWLVLVAIGVAVGVSVLAGWFPSRRAVRLPPVQALRHE